MSSENIEQLAYEHMLLTRHSSALGRKVRDGEGLERSAHILLSRLESQGPMTVAELSDAFLLDTSTIHRQVTPLLKAGLLERFPDPDGRLVRRLRLTEAGEKALRRHREAVHARLAELVADWDEEDVAAFVGYIRRFNRAIEERQGRPWPR
jgi:DNA-binding MarR family transcriptional regulator